MPDALTFEIRPRWVDFDALGHLNQSIYHVYLDEARDDALTRTVGDFETWPSVLARVQIDYRREIRRTVSAVTIATWIVSVGRSSVRFAQNVMTHDGELAAESESVVVAWDPGMRQSRKITVDEGEKLRAVCL